MEVVTQDDLLGTWQLLDFGFRKNHSNDIYPWGKNPLGYFIFTKTVCVVAMMEHYSKVFNNDFNINETEEDINFDNILNPDDYIIKNLAVRAGKYKLSDNKLIQYSEVSNTKLQVGLIERDVRIADGILDLSKDVILKGSHYNGYALWKKIES